MTPRQPAIALIVLAAIALIGIIFLAATGHSIPDVLAAVALIAVGGGAGAAAPTSTTRR